MGKMGISKSDLNLPLAVLPVSLSATNKSNSRNSRNMYILTATPLVRNCPESPTNTQSLAQVLGTDAT